MMPANPKAVVLRIANALQPSARKMGFAVELLATRSGWLVQVVDQGSYVCTIEVSAQGIVLAGRKKTVYHLGAFGRVIDDALVLMRSAFAAR